MERALESGEIKGRALTEDQIVFFEIAIANRD